MRRRPHHARNRGFSNVEITLDLDHLYPMMAYGVFLQVTKVAGAGSDQDAWQIIVSERFAFTVEHFKPRPSDPNYECARIIGRENDRIVLEAVLAPRDGSMFVQQVTLTKGRWMNELDAFHQGTTRDGSDVP